MTVQAFDASTERVFSKGFAGTSWNGASLPDVLALPRTMEITVLDTIRVYGIVIRESSQFPEGLSPALAVQIPNIVSVVAGETGLRGRPYRWFFEKSNPQEEKHPWKKTV
jgi:hypothetical protein